MKGIFTAAGTLISFGTEITAPSLIRSRELLLHPLGRREGGRVLVMSALWFSRSAQLIAPGLPQTPAQPRCSTQQATSTKVKSTMWMLQRRTLTRHR